MTHSCPETSPCCRLLREAIDTRTPRTRGFAAALAGLALSVSLSLLGGCGSSSDSANNTAAGASSGSNTIASGGNASTEGTTTTSSATTSSATTGSAKTSGAASTFAQQAVSQINAIRATARNCGGVSFAAAAPIAWNDKIEASAVSQADYMQSSNMLTHTGSGNSTLGQRVAAAGYDWSGVAENVAFGYDSLGDVLQGWVESPGHCANLMNPSYVEMGLAQSNDSMDAYWALVMAQPRS